MKSYYSLEINNNISSLYTYISSIAMDNGVLKATYKIFLFILTLRIIIPCKVLNSAPLFFYKEVFLNYAQCFV